MSYKYFRTTLNAATRDHFYKKLNEKKNINIELVYSHFNIQLIYTTV